MLTNVLQKDDNHANNDARLLQERVERVVPCRFSKTIQIITFQLNIGPCKKKNGQGQKHCKREKWKEKSKLTERKKEQRRGRFAGHPWLIITSEQTHTFTSIIVFESQHFGAGCPGIFQVKWVHHIAWDTILFRVAGSFSKQEHLFGALKKLRDIYSSGARERRSFIRASLTWPLDVIAWPFYRGVVKFLWQSQRPTESETG